MRLAASVVDNSVYEIGGVKTLSLAYRTQPKTAVAARATVLNASLTYKVTAAKTNADQNNVFVDIHQTFYIDDIQDLLQIAQRTIVCLLQRAQTVTSMSLSNLSSTNLPCRPMPSFANLVAPVGGGTR